MTESAIFTDRHHENTTLAKTQIENIKMCRQNTHSPGQIDFFLVIIKYKHPKSRSMITQKKDCYIDI